MVPRIGWDPVGSGERRRGVAEPHLDLVAPDHYRDCQQSDDPELAAKDVRVMTGMLVVAAVLRVVVHDTRL